MTRGVNFVGRSIFRNAGYVRSPLSAKASSCSHPKYGSATSQGRESFRWGEVRDQPHLCACNRGYPHEHTLYEKEAVTCLCVTSRTSRTIFSYPWLPLLLLPPPSSSDCLLRHRRTPPRLPLPPRVLPPFRRALCARQRPAPRRNILGRHRNCCVVDTPPLLS